MFQQMFRGRSSRLPTKASSTVWCLQTTCSHVLLMLGVPLLLLFIGRELGRLFVLFFVTRLGERPLYRQGSMINMINNLNYMLLSQLPISQGVIVCQWDENIGNCFRFAGSDWKFWLSVFWFFCLSNLY